MDNLLRQTRLRFSGAGQEKKEDSGSGGDQSIPPSQKTVSFKDQTKERNWFQRKFSRQMSQDYAPNGGDEHTTAVAAAAYAISSLDETGTLDQKQAKEVSRTSTITTNSKKEDRTTSIPEPGKSSMRRSENLDNKIPVTAANDTKRPEKASFWKTSSAVDKQPSGSSKQASGILEHGRGTSKPDLPTSAKPARTPPSADKQPSGSFKPRSSTSKPDLPTPAEPTPPPADTRRQSLTGPVMGKVKADIWEETELTRIAERFAKQTSTILTWEDKKKKKAKRRLEKQERELESKKAKAMERYRSKMQYIDQTVGPARAKAEEKKRNDVFKVKEKANTFRRTGKVPNTCSCF